MGILNFYSGFINKLTERGLKLDRLQTRPTGLLLDFNGVLHNVAQKVYNYGEYYDENKVLELETISDAELEQRYLIGIGSALANIILQIKPFSFLFIGIDGVAPCAKILQQRSRRYKNAKNKSRFDTACITPGTEFMFKIDVYLRNWIDTNREQLPPTVIYSSHLVPGEGEHKLFEYLRSYPTQTHSFAIYGLDTDLIMLSLLSPCKNIFLVRENFTDILNINVLKSKLVADLDEAKTLTRTLTNETRLIKDFVIMCFLVGNDFLPRCPHVYDVGDIINSCIDIYNVLRKNSSSERFMLYENNLLDLEFIGNFFYILSTQYEVNMLKHRSSLYYRYPSKILDESSDKIPLTQPNPSDRYITYEIVNFDFDKYRFLWYKRALSPRDEYASKRYVTDKEFLHDIITMTRAYIYCFQWIILYYIGELDNHSYISKDFFYPYIYTPLFKDTVSILIMMVKNEEYVSLNLSNLNETITPIHQLVMVTPVKSNNLLPSSVRNVQKSEIGYMFPEEFEVEYDGVNNDWQGIPILPPLEFKNIIHKINNLLNDKIPTKYNESTNWTSHIERKTSHHKKPHHTEFRKKQNQDTRGNVYSFREKVNFEKNLM